jgi:long-chain acyl-CoA synthetase
VIVDRLVQSVERQGTRTAFMHGVTSVTYAELDARSRRVAAALSRRGLGRGDRVGVLLDIGVDYPAACLGIWRAGAVAVPLDVRAPRDDLIHRHAVAGLRCLLTGRGGEVLPGVPSIGLDELDAVAPAPFRHRAVPEDDCLLLFTSGTTGGPKGLLYTGASVAGMAERHASSSGTTAADVVWATIPFFLFVGLFDLLLAPLITGASVVITQPFSPRAAIVDAARAGVTTITAVPPIFQLLAAVDEALPLPSLRRATVSAATLDAETRARFHKRFGLQPAQTYGMSEGGRIAATGALDSAPPPRSVGRPLIDIRLFAEDGEPVPAGEMGEIGIRPPTLCRPFYLLAGGRQEPLPMHAGYFLTGDLGRILPDESLMLAGRKKGFILAAKTKVDPHEVEAVLRRHPAVRDVAVVPAPGRAGYEAIRAVIVGEAGLTAREIGAFCAAHLPAGKRPEIIDFVPRIPRNAAGKVEIGRLTAEGGRPGTPSAGRGTKNERFEGGD